MTKDLIGKVLGGKYRLVRKLGEGGMGAVYEAEHTVITRRVAIKVLHPRFNESPEAIQRFVREAQASSSIGHPNIIEVFDVGQEGDDQHFIVMELLEGMSLAALVKAKGQLRPRLAVAIILETLAGLKMAHENGIIHRDMKPDNIFLHRNSDKTMTVKVLDFGISKILRDDPEGQFLTRTGYVMGTPIYMSPEQARGAKHVDGRTDIWAVGTILYQILSSRTPYTGNSYNEVLAKIVEKPILPLASLIPNCPIELIRIIGRALEKDKDQRYQDAQEFIQELQNLESLGEEFSNITSVTMGDFAVETHSAGKDSYEEDVSADAVTFPSRELSSPPPPVESAERPSSLRPDPGKGLRVTGRRARFLVAGAIVACVVFLVFRFLPFNGDSDADSVSSEPATESVESVETNQTNAEFQVNTTTEGAQMYPSVAGLEDGRFVVCWQSRYQDGFGNGIYSRWYDAMGAPIGGEVQVNTYTANDQLHPVATALSNGRVLFLWTSQFQDGYGYGVFGQLFDSNGKKHRSEFQVNTHVDSDQALFSVAPLSDGGFVVVWESHEQDGDEWGVFGQRFNGEGEKLGEEYRTNTTTKGKQKFPGISCFKAGMCVVVWESMAPNTEAYDIFAQIYDEEGQPKGKESRINTYDKGWQRWPVVTTIGEEGFVVMWSSANQDGAGNGIFGQYLDQAGEKQGQEFQVNSFSAGDQWVPSIAAFPNGDVVAAWMSAGQDGSEHGAFGQIFDNEGSRRGAEFQINVHTKGEQKIRSVATLPDGRFVVAWESMGQDGANWGILARIFPAEE